MQTKTFILDAINCLIALLKMHVLLWTTLHNLWATNHMQLRSRSYSKHSSQLQNSLNNHKVTGLLCMEGKYSHPRVCSSKQAIWMECNSQGWLLWHNNSYSYNNKSSCIYSKNKTCIPHLQDVCIQSVTFESMKSLEFEVENLQLSTLICENTVPLDMIVHICAIYIITLQFYCRLYFPSMPFTRAWNYLWHVANIGQWILQSSCCCIVLTVCVCRVYITNPGKNLTY